MTSSRNSDYGATKHALTGWSDSLRQELVEANSPVVMTNIYPYIVDTQLFKGFSGLALWLVPILRKQDVAYRIYRAIMFQEEDVYMPWYTYWMGVAMMFVPSLRLRIWIIQVSL